MKTVLITGASSGIGFETAKRFCESGWRVFAGARRLEKMEPLRELGAETFYLDVCDDASCKEAVSRCDTLNVLVNCAGYGQYGPIECVTDEDAMRQMDTNVFGVIRMCRYAAPKLRGQGSGRIINVTSCGGRATTYLGGLYHMSKYAAESLTDALRMELQPFGVRVVAIEPGLIKTAWEAISAEHLLKTGEGTVYEQDCRMVASAYNDAQNWSAVTAPETVAKYILRAATAKRPKARYLFGFGARPLLAARTLLPTSVYDRIMRNMYRMRT